MNATRYTMVAIILVSINLLGMDNKPGVGPGFSLLNKSNQFIFVVVDNGNQWNINAQTENLRGYESLGAEPFAKQELSIKNRFQHIFSGKEPESTTTLSPYEENERMKTGISHGKAEKRLKHKNMLFENKKIDWKSKPTTVSLFDRNTNLIYQAKFPAGKTIYVHWNGRDLYPQTGPMRGAQGTTDLGFYLNKNVQDNDIQVTFRKR